MAPSLEVFAIEDTTVQLTWSGLPARRMTIGVGPSSVSVDAGPAAWLHREGRSSRRLSDCPGGPGAAVVEGLEPATTYDVWMSGAGDGRRTVGRVTTLAPPPGALLSRFCTISDMHVGERSFGLLGSIVDVRPRSAGLAPYAARSVSAALAEAAAWGATTVIAKGDLTAHSHLVDFRTVADLLRGSGLDALVQLGNHDRRGRTDPAAALGGLPVAFGPGDPLVRDLPGVRLILGDSSRAHTRIGHLDNAQIDRLASAAEGAAGGAVVSLHHPPEPRPLATSYPPGLARAATRKLIAALRSANPATIVIAGHTHRNRTYRVDGELVAEVGSTKDYPGAWAGYAVHEGGIRQVVRRTARPDIITWTEATAAALGGVWGRWSPGRLSDRCWSHAWPER